MASLICPRRRKVVRTINRAKARSRGSIPVKYFSPAPSNTVSNELPAVTDPSTAKAAARAPVNVTSFA
jgi:hypothetical protein